MEYTPQLLQFFGTRPSKSCWTHNTYFYYKFQCSYNKLLNNNCTFDNDNNTLIYNKIKNGNIQTYPENGQSVLIEGKNNYIFQITTDDNEVSTLNGNLENKIYMSIIDLGECENLLKKENNINEYDNLIILKFEKKTNIASDKNVQYEIYDPITLKKLYLFICENIFYSFIYSFNIK